MYHNIAESLVNGMTESHLKMCHVPAKSDLLGKVFNIFKKQALSREKFAAIVLVYITDNYLWFRHVAFRFLGALNEINIWEHSLLFDWWWPKNIRGSILTLLSMELTFWSMSLFWYYLFSSDQFIVIYLWSNSQYWLQICSTPYDNKTVIEYACRILKMSFLDFTHDKSLHYRDDPYYLGFATILLFKL